MKKIVLFILIPVMVFFAVSCVNKKPDKDFHTGSFTAEKTYSYDNAFYALQHTETGVDALYIVVDIYKSKNGEKIFSFSPARAMDFWGICWEETTYNIWVQSADIGTICYEYQNGSWTKNENAVRPAEIISKYD